MTPSNRRVGPPRVPPEAADAAHEGSLRPEGARTSDAPPAAPPARGPVWSAVRTGLGVILVVGASLGVAWLARRHVTQSPRFAVSRIEVSGNSWRPTDALIAESGLAVGSNVFLADLDIARSRLLADAWIADAVLERRLPGTILVHVTERRAAALVAAGDLLLCTPEGEPFKPLEPGDPAELPIVTGIAPETLRDDRDGAIRTIRHAIDLASELENSPVARLRSPLQEVHVDPDGSLTLVVGHDATRVVLGGAPFRHKLDQAARALAEVDRRGTKADTVLVDNETRPDRVVVRLR